MSKLNGDQAEGLRRIMTQSKSTFYSFISASTAKDDGIVCNLLAKEAEREGVQDFIIYDQIKSRQEFNISIHQQSLLINQMLHSSEVLLTKSNLKTYCELPPNILDQTKLLIYLNNNPTSIKTAYQAIKKIQTINKLHTVKLLIKADDERLAKTIYNNIAKLVHDFENIDLAFAGFISTDDEINLSISFKRRSDITKTTTSFLTPLPNTTSSIQKKVARSRTLLRNPSYA
ncbi:MAG: hypothetical protein WCK52_06320 [Betaproteobacteria bacterium]